MSKSAPKAVDPWRNSDPAPRLKKNIGYAMLPIEFAELGTEVAVETPDERTSAIVVRKPFVDPQKEIPKQHHAAAAKDN